MTFATLPRELAQCAHSGTSFVPYQRATQEQDGFTAHLQGLYSELLTHCKTDEMRAVLESEFERYQERYSRLYRAYLASKSRCMSTMIAGPSNFPVRRMEKRNAVVDRRRSELIEFQSRAKAAIIRELHPERRPIMTGDANASERLADKIAEAEHMQNRMRAANAAIRKHKKAGPEAQIAALVALEFSEGIAKRLLEPDFCGRIGFADYQLTNNNANIRRMKERLEHVSAVQALPTVEAEGEAARVEDSPADNRVRLFFPGKPSAEIRTDLKRCGFRWSPTIGAWQAYRNAGTIAKAQAVAQVA